MRCILPLSVIATTALASAAQDSVFPYRSRAEGVDTLRYVDLKGGRKTADKDEMADLIKAVFGEEGESGLGLEEKVVVVVVNDDEEEKIVADLIKQKDKRESSQSSPSTVVESVKKTKEKKKSTKETHKQESSKKESSKEESQTVPSCPPHYSTSGTYKAGDTIESKSNVWECQADPYEEYCSIVELNEGWNDEIKQLWLDSWVHVGACEKLVVTNQPTKGPTSSPTKEPTTSPTFSEVEVKMSSTIPPCPPQYNTSVTYAAGDTIEVELNIWKCRHTPYVKYCSIADMKESWNDDTKALWKKAWVHVSACEKLSAEDGDASATTIDIIDAPITTKATTPTVTTTEVSIISTIALLPMCPSAYDPSKTNYIAGEQVTVKCKIFRCKDEDHEKYCNISAWDDSLPVKMWKDAWELVGDCEPTQGEFMEEEAANGGGAWNCIG